jgi:hypothetical protein
MIGTAGVMNRPDSPFGSLIYSRRTKGERIPIRE